MGKQWDFIFLGCKITADGDCSHEIKRHLLLGRKVMTNLDSILKSRDIALPTKQPKLCQHSLLWVPWTARRSNQSILKGISPEFSLEGTYMQLKLKLQQFGHLMQRADSFEKTLMLGKIEGRRRRGWKSMRWLDGITDSMDMSLCKPHNWWWTGSPGMLQFMWLQRVGHDWATELNWTEANFFTLFFWFHQEAL